MNWGFRVGDTVQVLKNEASCSPVKIGDSGVIFFMNEFTAVVEFADQKQWYICYEDLEIKREELNG